MIAVSQLTEGFVCKTILIYVLQQLGTLMIVGTLVVAVGELLTRSTVVTECISLLVVLQRLVGTILLHTTVTLLQE